MNCSNCSLLLKGFHNSLIRKHNWQYVANKTEIHKYEFHTTNDNEVRHKRPMSLGPLPVRPFSFNLQMLYSYIKSRTSLSSVWLSTGPCKLPKKLRVLDFYHKVLSPSLSLKDDPKSFTQLTIRQIINKFPWTRFQPSSNKFRAYKIKNAKEHN